MAEFDNSVHIFEHGSVEAKLSQIHLFSASANALGNLSCSNQLIHNASPGVIHISQSIGDTDVPHDVVRQRRYILEMTRRFGAPVIIKHMFTPEDERRGIAKKAPSFSSTFGQTRAHDLTYGTGYVSIETWDKEWMDPSGVIVVSDTSPGADWVPAPKYRGYGPGYLTWVVEPDVVEDVFKLTTAGVMTRTQSAQIQMGWKPEVQDNDLIINVELDTKGSPTEPKERFEAKMVSPVTFRGKERRGLRERGVVGAGGNRYLVQQNFEATKLPLSSEAMLVPIDR